MTKISGIYKYESKTTHKVYIGGSRDISRRISRHKTDLKYQQHHNIYLQRHANKYGIDDLMYSIVEQTPLDDRVIIDREIYWIAIYNSSDPSKGFNLNQGGLGGYYTRRKHKNFTLVRLCDGTRQTFPTVEDFEDMMGVSSSYIRALFSKPSSHKSCMGWTTEQHYQKLEWCKKRKLIKTLIKVLRKILPKPKPPPYIKHFSLKNRLTGEVFSCSNIREFCIKYSLCYNSILRVVRGERKRHKNWIHIPSPTDVPVKKTRSKKVSITT